MGSVVQLRPGTDPVIEPPKPNKDLIQYVEELLAAARAGEIRTCLCVFVPDGHATAGRFHAYDHESDLALMLLETRRLMTHLEVEEDED